MKLDGQNVLVLASWFNPSNTSGSFFYEQAELLFKAGANVCLAFPALEKDNVYNGKIGNIDVLSFDQVKYPYRHIYIVGILESLINKRLMYRFFKRNLQNKKINAVIAQNIQNAGFWALWLNKKFNLPFIAIQHNPFVPNNDNYYTDNWRVGYVMKSSIMNFSVSTDLLRRFRLFGRYEKMRVLNNPISLPFQDSETVIKHGKSEKTCITIGISGQYCSIKNQDLLLKSLKFLKINAKVDLLIIWLGFDSWNRGVNQNDLEKQIASYGFPENVHTELHSVISRDNMLEKMKSCDVFVSTSYNETFGLTCLEALSLGIPVCTTQNGGCNEFMTDFNGVIVNSFEEIDFASALSDIINNLEKYDQKKIRAYALSRFSSDVYINTIFSSGLFN